MRFWGFPPPPRRSSSHAGAAAAVLAAVAAASCVLALRQEARCFPRKAVLALRADEAAALCRRDGCALSEFLERARLAGASAALVPDRAWAELAADGEASYFPRGEVRALKAVGLLDPTASFPEDSLWVRDRGLAAGLAGSLSDAGLSYSTRTVSGSVVFSFPSPPPLARRLAGPDPDLVAASRAAGLDLVYVPRRWDGESAAVLRRFWSGAGPTAVLADFSRDERAAYLDSAEARLAKPGSFIPVARPFGAELQPASSLAAAPADEAGDAGVPAPASAWDRLSRVPLSDAEDEEQALSSIRAAAAALRRAGTEPSSEADVFPAAWPPRLAWLRWPAAFAAAALFPLAGLALALALLRRGLRSRMLPLAAPVWQLAAAYAACCAAAVVLGLLLHGVLFPLEPGPASRLARALPFLLYIGFSARWDARGLDKRLSRPLRVREGLLLAAALPAAWALWGLPYAPFGAAAFLPWRSVLVGAPCLMGALWLRSRREAGLKVLWRDERPLLFLALWLPTELLLAFYLSPAPFWTVARDAAEIAVAGGLSGSAILAAISYLEARSRSRAVRPVWA